jgi:hypothetical protein
MTAQIHALPAREAVVTKRQLARTLGKSERWVEQRAAEGMPALGLDRMGRRTYSLRACQDWLASNHQKPHRDRLGELEARLRSVEERLGISA